MGFLSSLFRRTPDKSIEHPVFGKLILCKGAAGPYWMHEVYEGEEGLTISIETRDGEEPSQEQVDFFRRKVGDIEKTIVPVLPAIAERYAEMHRQALPENWTEALKLAGIGVPIDCDGEAPWDVTFVCLTNNSGFLYTCYFEEGQLAHVSVDT